MLPAATWGERTGTFTNADRTVHLSETGGRSARRGARATSTSSSTSPDRMDFRDRDGEPLIRWHDPESAFEAWKECSRGRPCDYSGMTYDELRGGAASSGRAPTQHPDGVERLYTDGGSTPRPTSARRSATTSPPARRGRPTEYRALDPDGRAFLYGVEYEPGPEPTDDDYPMLLTTGRTVYQFHTRTKTGRAPQLDAAAPDAWVEISADDAAALGIDEGDLVRVESRTRAASSTRARISDIRPGVVFVPFHYGTWRSEQDTSPADTRIEPRTS